MRVVLSNANVIDCVHPRPLAGASVTVEHGRIVEVLESSRSPDTHQAQVIDLHGAYLLPGLWDVHIHPDYFTAAKYVRRRADGAVWLPPHGSPDRERCGRRALCWLGLLHGRGLETRL